MKAYFPALFLISILFVIFGLVSVPLFLYYLNLYLLVGIWLLPLGLLGMNHVLSSIDNHNE